MLELHDAITWSTPKSFKYCYVEEKDETLVKLNQLREKLLIRKLEKSKRKQQIELAFQQREGICL